MSATAAPRQSALGASASASASASTSASKPVSVVSTTFRSLFEAVEEQALTPADLATHLRLHMPAIRSALDYYTPPSSASRSALLAGRVSLQSVSSNTDGVAAVDSKQATLDKNERDFVCAVSDDLAVDEALAVVLVRACLRSEVQTPAALRRLGLDSFKYGDEALAVVRAFYYQERQSLLHLIAALYRVSYDPAHTYYDIITDVVISDLHDSETPYYELLLGQLTAANTAQGPAKYLPEAQVYRLWAGQNLEEQIALAETLMLVLYGTAATNLVTAERVFRAMYGIRFGVEQRHRPVYDDVMTGRVGTLNHLCQLAPVIVLHFEGWMDFQTRRSRVHGFDDEDDDEGLAGVPAFLERMTALVWDSIHSRPAYLPQDFDAMAAMAWAAFVNLLLLRSAELAALCPALGAHLARLLETETRDPRSASLLAEYAYMKMAAVATLADVLKKQAPYTDDGPNALAAKSVVKGYLLAVFTTQRVGQLPDREKLVATFAALFDGESDLCRQFWDEDFPSAERRSLLDVCRRRVPIDLAPFAQLVTSLVGDAYTARRVFYYMCSMHSYADTLRDGYSIDQDVFGSHGGRYVWGGGRLVGSLEAPAGTTGREVGAGTLLLDFRYSGWQLFEAILESYLAGPGSDGAGDGPAVATHDAVSAILKLLAAFFGAADAATVAELMDHLGTRDGTPAADRVLLLVARVLDRACVDRVPRLELATSCIHVMRRLLPYYPDLVWRHLRSHMLVPQYSTSAGGLGAGAGGGSYMQRVVLPVERSAGRYDATVAFLEMVCDLVDQAQGLLVPRSAEDLDAETHDESDGESQLMDTSMASSAKTLRRTPPGTPGTPGTPGLRSARSAKTAAGDMDTTKADVLHSILSFAIYEVFPTHRSWRYQHLLDKVSISSVILDVLSRVLRHTVWANAAASAGSTGTGSGLARVYWLVAQAFLQADSVQHVATLLDVVGTGNEAMHSLYRSYRGQTARAAEACVVNAMGLVVVLGNRWRELGGKGTSTVEAMLMDRTVKSSAGSGGVGGAKRGADLLQVAGQYVLYEPSREIRLRAVEVLAMLCEETADAGSTAAGSGSMSLVGYFGDDAQAIVDKLVGMVRVADERSVRWDPDMQTAVLRFVCGAVGRQPGIAALMFAAPSTALAGPAASTDKTTATRAESKAGSSTMIDAVMSVVTGWRQAIHSRPLVLIESMRLLCCLWQTALDHTATLAALRLNRGLWTVLRDMLLGCTVSDLCRDGGDGKGDRVRVECLVDAVRSSAMRIVALEAYFSSGVTGVSSVHRDTINALVADVFLGPRFLDMFSAADDSSSGGGVFPLGPVSMERAMQMAGSVTPAVELAEYRLPTHGAVFGPSYMFDVELLRRQAATLRLGGGTSSSRGSAKGYDQLLWQVERLNWEWSRTDATMTYLSAARFFAEVVCTRLWAICWPAKSDGNGPGSRTAKARDAAFDMARRLAGMLARDTRMETVVLRYRGVVAALVRVLVSAWLAAFPMADAKTPATQQQQQQQHHQNVDRIVELIGDLVSALTGPSVYTLGPAGLVSAHEAHLHLLIAAHQAVASLNRRIPPTTTTAGTELGQRIAETLRPLVGFVVQGLSYVLGTGDLARSESGHVRIVSALLIELISRPEVGDSVWGAAAERFGLVRMLVAMMSKAEVPSGSGSDVGGTGASAGSGSGGETWEAFDCVVMTVMAFTRRRRFAERFAGEGLLSGVTGSAFATVMVGEYGGPGVDGRIRKTWGVVVDIVTQMVGMLGGGSTGGAVSDGGQFDGEIHGVVGMLGRYLLVTVSGIAHGGMYGQVHGEWVTRLDHVEQACRMLCAVVDVLGRRRQSGDVGAFVGGAQHVALDAVAVLSHLFVSPHELAGIVAGMARTTGASREAGGQADGDQEAGTETAMAMSMRRIVRDLVLILVVTTGAEGRIGGGGGGGIQTQTQTQTQPEVQTHLVLEPRMAAMRDERCSFGTLFNLVRSMVKSAEAACKTRDSGATTSKAADARVCVQTIEASLLLLVTQTQALESHGVSDDDVAEIRGELQSTLDELRGVLEPGASTGAATASSGSLEFVQFLRTVVGGGGGGGGRSVSAW